MGSEVGGKGGGWARKRILILSSAFTRYFNIDDPNYLFHRPENPPTHLKRFMNRFNVSLLTEIANLGDYRATSGRSHSQVDTGSEVAQREISKNIRDQFHSLHLFVAGNIVVDTYYVSLDSKCFSRGVLKCFRNILISQISAGSCHFFHILCRMLHGAFLSGRSLSLEDIT